MSVRFNKKSYFPTLAYVQIEIPSSFPAGFITCGQYILLFFLLIGPIHVLVAV